MKWKPSCVLPPGGLVLPRHDAVHRRGVPTHPLIEECDGGAGHEAAHLRSSMSPASRTTPRRSIELPPPPRLLKEEEGLTNLAGPMGGRVAGQGRERAGSGDRRRCVGGAAGEGGREGKGFGSGQDPRRHAEGLGSSVGGERRRWMVTGIVQ
jgi:hypothetical protein